MSDWWNSLETIEMIFWLIAIISSLFFVIVLLMSFFGGDVDADMDVDTEIDSDTGIGFQFFTLKNLVGFFTIFGWTGIAMIDSGYSTGAALIAAFTGGLIMMIVMASTFFFLSKMISSGTLNMKNAIGAVGEVYLPIQKERGSIGKIHIKVQGSLRELEALTDEKEDLSRGSVIKVTQIISEELLLVEKLKAND